ncbi:MAG: hypothetical protein AAFR47_06405 [Pseudomonadota bacterium]
MKAVRILAAAIGLAVVATPGLAGDCPHAIRDAVRERALLDDLARAENEAAARKINAALWELWTDAPDPHAQKLLDSGMARLRVGDFRAARSAFDTLVDYCPDYAEGYNQRAFAHYLQHNFGPALVDLDHALVLSPNHIGALSGRALVLMGLGRDREALDQLKAALALNPWLSERSLVPVLQKRLGETDL